MHPRFFLNGKFLAQPTTGVQRVASQHLRCLDAMGPPWTDGWTLLCPAGAVAPALLHVRVREVGSRDMPLHLWEQLCLPWAARSGTLVSLAGSAPWFARRQAAMVHDAAVWDRPEAYTRAFVTWYRSLFRRLARRARPLMTVSEFSAARLAHWLSLPPGRLVVVPNGGDHLQGVEADPCVIHALGLTGRPFMLSVASANPSKNIEALVRAFATLKRDDGLCLLLVGGRNARVFAAVGVADDPPGVVRSGPLGDAALKALYRQARALVFPSLYEGFGLPVLEAMGEGCPVIAADAAALPEVCGDAALRVDPQSVPALAQAMAKLAGDPAARARLERAGRGRAAGFRWSEATRRLLQSLHAESGP